MSYHPQQSGMTDPHEMAVWPADPGPQQVDMAGEIVEDEPTGEMDGAKVDPFASTDPPRPSAVEAGAPEGRTDELLPEELAALEARAGDDEPFEGQPTRVEPHPELPESDVGIHAARLVVIGGADRGRQLTLKDGETTIGRGLDNDLVLADIAVSRHHTTVVGKGGVFELRDLGSGNGTLVNGARVPTHDLRGGDQIELGNTLLRFVTPTAPTNAALGEAETQVGEIVSASADVATAVPPPEAIATAQEMVVDARSATEPRRKGMSRAKKLLLFGGLTLVAFFGVMLVLKAKLDRRKAQPTAVSPLVAQPKNAAAAAAEHFDRGRNYLRNRQWSEARDEFEKVYGLAPGEHVKRYIRQAKAEVRAQQAIEDVKRALANESFAEARATLAKVPQTSIYATDLPKLKESIDTAQVDQLLSQARARRESGNLESAREAAEQALRIAPTDLEVRQMLDELGRPVTHEARAPERHAAGERAVPSASPTGRVAQNDNRSASASVPERNSQIPLRKSQVAPRKSHRSSSAALARRSRSSSHTRSQPLAKQPAAKTTLRGRSKRVLQQALALYGKSDWSGAAALLEQQADQEPDSSRKSALQARAKAMRKVGASYQKALEVQTRNPGLAIAAYRAAIKADKRAGDGTHQKKFQERLYKVARVHAISSVSTGRYDSAYKALTLAKTHGPLDSQLKSVQETLEKRASDLFTKGYTIRSRNPSEARRLWQRVLRMVPPESAVYQKAYKWLNNATAPAYLDEDEL